MSSILDEIKSMMLKETIHIRNQIQLPNTEISSRDNSV